MDTRADDRGLRGPAPRHRWGDDIGSELRGLITAGGVVYGPRHRGGSAQEDAL